MQLIMRKHWKLWVVGNHVDHCNLNIQKKIVAAQTACVWRIGIGRDVLVLLVSQLYNQILQGLLTMLSSCVGMGKLGRKKEDEWKKFIALYVRMKQQFAL